MKTTFKSFGGAIIASQWEGKEDRISLLGREWIIHEKDKGEIYDFLINKLHFEEFKNRALNKDLSDLPYSEAFKEKYLELQELSKDAKIKITIKIELEKYE